MDILDWIYIVIGVVLFIGISIAGSAYAYFNDAVKKCKDMCSLGLPANEFAKSVIASKGLEISINKIEGKYSDNYYSKGKVLNMSESVFDDFSTTAIAVTAHELGHAISDNNNSATFKIRMALANICYILNRLFWVVLVASFVCFIAMLDSPEIAFWILIAAGIIFVICLLFKLLTLSTELEASRFAVKILKEYDLETKEIKKAKKLYRAAATTYVGEIFMPFVQLIKFIGFIIYNTIGRLFR